MLVSHQMSSLFRYLTAVLYSQPQATPEQVRGLVIVNTVSRTSDSRGIAFLRRYVFCCTFQMLMHLPIVAYGGLDPATASVNTNFTSVPTFLQAYGYCPQLSYGPTNHSQ